MTGSVPQRGQFVVVGTERSDLSAALYGLGLGAISVSVQILLVRYLAPDSYQLLLGAVAISVMCAGVRAGLTSLVVTAVAKCVLPVETPPHLADFRSLVRFALFLCLGLLICWLGQKLHASERKVRLLSGLLPICAWCKKVRDENGEWAQLEVYIRDHSEADFTHSLCPDCARQLVN